MKEESGITFPVLIIVVIILAILVCVVVFLISQGYKDEEFTNIRTDMLSVQGKVKVLSESSIAKKDESLKKGLKITENEEDPKVKELLDKGVISKEEDYDSYYILNKDTLNEMGLDAVNVKDGQYIIVNYKTYEVIYSQGIEIDNNEYFKLSEINKIQEDKQVALTKEQEEKESQEAEEAPVEIAVQTPDENQIQSEGSLVAEIKAKAEMPKEEVEEIQEVETEGETELKVEAKAEMPKEEPEVPEEPEAPVENLEEPEN